MNKLVIKDLENNTLDQWFSLQKHTESQLQSFWVESLKKYGPMIILTVERVKYIEIGVSI